MSIRPQTPAEVVEGCGVCARAGGAAGEGGVALGSERAFTFDYAFEPTADQREVYDTCVRKLVEAALDGYNATVLAYGQYLLEKGLVRKLKICSYFWKFYGIPATFFGSDIKNDYVTKI
ncbi:unnamed protein product [Euphydryas editha]|uniref:Kinesin motor domain-containing protein n=1 Tax=Euphydryas editha TaxID=104508 RepID=A0AAU9UW31_EUPED|nr:unnamed protein product [Euphydryas editha]